jgi:antitoxin VapB
MMLLHIEDDATVELVRELADRRGVSEQDAVTLAVTAELDRLKSQIPLRDRLRNFRAENPLPPKTRLVADKAFFDELSGEP